MVKTTLVIFKKKLKIVNGRRSETDEDQMQYVTSCDFIIFFLWEIAKQPNNAYCNSRLLKEFQNVAYL